MHLNPKIALDLAEGTMKQSEKSQLDKHLTTCTECADEVQAWTDLLKTVSRAHLLSAPPEAVLSAKKIFRAKTTWKTRSSLRQIVATVLFDSFAEPAASTVRAEAAHDNQAVRQVVFQAEEYDIYLRLSMFEDHRDLLGQILPRESREFITDASLSLRHHDERIASTAVNELGEFQFCDVPDGMLSLQIDLPNVTIISALSVNA
jgi:hypothetical protein